MEYRLTGMMKHNCTIIILVVLIFKLSHAGASDTLKFRGQASAWAHWQPGGEVQLGTGGRIIPQANLEFGLPHHRMLDFEASLNINGYTGLIPAGSAQAEGNAKIYRLWGRFSGRQYEIRAGMQKINFGSATLLRPLMWFDQMDARDPLQLTEGVSGLLGRYYFLDNTNLWLWALYGNSGSRAWDIGKTLRQAPEAGARIQLPLKAGEAAFTYHYRAVDPTSLNSLLPVQVTGEATVPEHRFAIDGKWDVLVGLWFEAVWVHKSDIAGPLANQQLASIGIDYTLGWGNGLHAMAEHLVFSMDRQPFGFENTYSFSALSLSYPLGIHHNLNAIFYHDWKNAAQYNFVNWQIITGNFQLNCMAFLNPDRFVLPQQASGSRLFAGKGLQFMVVYNF